MLLQIIRTFRCIMYPALKYSGDVQAVLSGRVKQRIGWRASGKIAGRVLGQLWR